MAYKPIVAIVGRPNVGKSTFVNRLLGARHSIVDDKAGVTRDRIYFDVEWMEKEFTVIDTGGIIPGDEDEIMLNIYSQAKIACEEADKIIFIVDGKEGINPVDYDIANILRKSNKEVFLAVNKLDSPDKFINMSEFYALALGDPVAISALHGSGGVGDLLEAVTKDFEYIEDEEENTENIRIAIVGKPNVGKSSIVNALLNKERVIVSDISGTTRDAIDAKVKYEGEEFILVDTAGIRKKSKVDWGIEKFAVDRSIRAIRNCDIAVLVTDAKEGITEQDKKIAAAIIDAGKGMILAINKWDLIEDKQSSTINKFEKYIENELPFLNYVPKIFISAKTKQRLVSIYKVSKEVYAESEKRISTSLLNKVILDAVSMNPPVSIRVKRLKLYYAAQVKTHPPSFVLFINSEKLLKDNYIKYLENKLREAFGFKGNPIRINSKEKGEKK
ncbi:MAG: ribosome biogenesis GTPase Der [Candidatus Gastranaerophilales bacterium]|nr:ribosome biogenesis GTPase Der [Candidatus Gastranaerophilales bacterium]